MFSEPAINRVQSGSYTTISYEFQPPNTFPTVNCPLYSLSLVPWLSAAGTSLLAVRSWNYALMALAAFLCWNASWRFGLVRSCSARLLLLLVLHLGYGMTYSYRCCRPDILGLVSLLLLLLTFRVKHRGLREFCLAALAAVTVWIGLQVTLFAGFASLAAWVMLRRPTFREHVVLALGLVAGAASLYLFYTYIGVFAYFVPAVLGHVQGQYYARPPESISYKLAKFARDTALDHLGDYSMAALTPLLLIFATIARNRLTLAMRRPSLPGRFARRPVSWPWRRYRFRPPLHWGQYGPFPRRPRKDSASGVPPRAYWPGRRQPADSCPSLTAPGRGREACIAKHA